jgi:hypothetical protein
LSTRPPHGDSIPAAFATVLQVTHDLPHEVESESTGDPVFERRCEIGRGSRQRVEGVTAIGILHVDAVVVKVQPNVDGILHSRAAPMPDRIGKQLLEDEIQLELRFLTESMLAAEFYCFDYQALEFFQAPVEDDFRFGQNCLIVAYWPSGFNRGKRTGRSGRAQAMASLG